MDTAGKTPVISVDKLKSLLDKGSQIVIVDLLPPEVYEKRRLPGAGNACVFEVTFPDQIRALAADLETEIVIYGVSSDTRDSAEAAAKLNRMGYRNVSLLDGGIEAWLAAGLRVDGDDPEGVDTLDAWLNIENRTYRVVSSESSIGWAGRNPNGKHYGTVELVGGSLTFENGEAAGRFEIDLTSIKNIDLEGNELQPVLLAHLKSDDFFFVDRFPKAFFNIHSARPVEHPLKTRFNFEVQGELDLKGLRAPLDFRATANPTAEGRVVVEAHFDFDRTQWGVIYGSSRFFRHLSYHLVFDLISVELRIVLE